MSGAGGIRMLPIITFDVDRQVANWRQGADEDWHVGAKLVEDGSSRHGLFFAHLARSQEVLAWLTRQS